VTFERAADWSKGVRHAVVEVDVDDRQYDRVLRVRLLPAAG
jgi:hypothetical protein